MEPLGIYHFTVLEAATSAINVTYESIIFERPVSCEQVFYINVHKFSNDF